MTKTEYTAAIATTQTAISTTRADLRKLRNIEKLAKSFSDLKLVDSSVLNTTITEKKAELTKLRAELSKARRIVKRMTEIEDIEAGKAGEPKPKKSAAEKKSSGTAKKSTEKQGDGTTTKKKTSKKTDSTATKAEAGKTEQPVPIGEVKQNAAA